MKRFIAYLSILISVVLGVVIVAKPAVQGINGGYDFDGSREFVYQIVNHGETIDDFNKDAFQDDSAVTKIAEEFENRLISYDVEKYDIVTEGNDKIRVRFTAKDDTEYQYISNYLTADGNLSLVTFDGEVVYNNWANVESGDDTVMFGEKDAYLTYKDSIFPGIVIPLTDAKTFNEKAVKHAEEINVPSEDGGTPVSQEGNIYLWSRYNADTDNFENAENNENIKNKLILSFQYNNIWFEEKEEDYSSIVFYFNVEGIDENTKFETINWNAVEKATDTAKYYLHLINASHLDQRVYLLSENKVDANLETLVNEGMSIEPAMSQTLLAVVISFAIIAAVSIFFYRLNGLLTSVSAGLGALLTLFIYNALGATLSFPGIIGFMIVTILMYACSITYSTKFSGELLKGKNSKKAFIDSTKKSAWVTLDLSVITLIAGIFIFLLGNSYISGCGIILFFGAFLNLAIQFIVNGSGLYFLSTSHYGLNNRGLITSKFVNKEKEAEKAEEVKEEETKEEVKEEIKPKKAKLPAIFGGILGVVALACTIGLSVFAGVSTPYSEQATFDASSYAYVYVKRPNTQYNTVEKIEEDLNLIRYQDTVDGETIYTEVYTSIDQEEYENYTNPDESNQSTKFEYYIYSIELNSNINLKSAENFVIVTLDADGAVTSASAITSLEECLVTTFGNIVTLNFVNDYNLTKTYNLGTIAHVTFITIAVVGIYFFLRYGRFIAIIGASTASAMSIICLGLFALLRTSVYNYIAYAAIPVAIIALFIVAYVSIKYKEIINENKVKVVDLKFKREIAVLSTDPVKNSCALIAAIAGLVLVCFFGFSTKFVSNTFLVALFGSIFTYLFVALVYNAYLIKLYDKIGNIQIKTKAPKSNKKRLKQQHKSRQRGKEVEEATFIGIND